MYLKCLHSNENGYLYVYIIDLYIIFYTYPFITVNLDTILAPLNFQT